MKCYLIGDMPKCCYLCDHATVIHSKEMGDFDVCKPTENRIEDIMKKPDWCPLNPIDNKKERTEYYGEFYKWMRDCHIDEDYWVSLVDVVDGLLDRVLERK